MAVETATYCDWLTLLTSGTLIPVSAFVAICLFMLREFLDWRRKSKALKNEIRALKMIFARECQLAWSIKEQIKEICEQFAPYEFNTSLECPLELSISNTAAGKTRFMVRKTGESGVGGELREPSAATFTKHLYDVSKLNSVFYEKVNEAYIAVIELKHLYDSLVDNDDTSKLMGVESVMLGFSGYALEEMKWIERDLKALYQYCTGEELTEGLLR